MKIRVKLMGMMKDKTPAGGQLELLDGATITDAVAALQIPLESVQAFTVNGDLQRDRTHVLTENDELCVLPPVGGG